MVDAIILRVDLLQPLECQQLTHVCYFVTVQIHELQPGGIHLFQEPDALDIVVR